MNSKEMQEQTANGQLTTPAEEVQRLWKKYFPGIRLTKTEWFEIYELTFVKKGLRIAAKNRKEGKKFAAEDEKNIGKYVVGIIRNLVQGKPRPTFLAKATVYFPASYQITEKDRSRFRAKLMPSGDHLLFRGAPTRSGYKKFWANHRSVGAHLFAFFETTGRLPDPNGLGGPNGLQIAHQCGVRNCCNPHHLCLTTKAVNLWQRGLAGEASNLPTETRGIDLTRYGSSYGMSGITTEHMPIVGLPASPLYEDTKPDPTRKSMSTKELTASTETVDCARASSLPLSQSRPAEASETQISTGGDSL